MYTFCVILIQCKPL